MSYISDPLVFAMLVALIGAAAGFCAGLFGVGGGIVTVPAMLYLFKLSNIPSDDAMHAAVGISMMTIVLTSINSSRAHGKRGAIEREIVKAWAPAVLVSSLIGSITAHYVSGNVLGLIFGCFMAVLSLYMGLAPQKLQALKSPPGRHAQQGIAFGIGFLSSLVGIAGGSLSVPVMVLCRTPIHRAVGTASILGLLIAFPAAVVFLVTQFLPQDARAAPDLFGLDLIAFGLLAVFSMLTAPFGARLTHKLPAAKLKRYFALLLGIIAVKMLTANIG